LWQDAFPDCNAQIKTTYVDGDTVIQQAIFQGTHTGRLNAPEQAPIDATTRKASFPFVNICTVRDGKITSWALYFDRADLMAQLGVGG
jgi:predicted ester cyclase